MIYMIMPRLNLFLSKTSVLAFLAGILVGLASALFLMTSYNSRYYPYMGSSFFLPVPKYDFDLEVGHHSPEDTHHKMTNSSIADKLFHEIRILCWIMTGPKNHKTRAQHVKATWGKRCNYLIFMSSEKDPDLPSVALPVREGRAHLWQKTKEAMKYIYKHYYDKADWFFKADDDSYTVMENMRYLLHFSKPTKPIYYGCKLKNSEHTFMSGGAGYVLSKEALKRFIIHALPNKSICKQDNTGDEDVELGKCLKAVGVELGDTLDSEDRNTFTPLFVNDMLIPGYLNEVEWYSSLMYHPPKDGMECCSDNLITTHYINSYQMYLLEYLIYHVTPFGIAYQPTLERSEKKTKTRFRSGMRSSTSTESSASVKELRWNDYD